MSVGVGLIGLVALGGLVALLALVLYWVFNSRRSGRVGVSGLLLVLLIMGGLAALLLPAASMVRRSKSPSSTAAVWSPQAIDDAIVETVVQIRRSFREKMPDEGPPKLIMFKHAPNGRLSQALLRRVEATLKKRGVTERLVFGDDFDRDWDSDVDGLTETRYEIELDLTELDGGGVIDAICTGYFPGKKKRTIRVNNVQYRARAAGRGSSVADVRAMSVDRRGDRGERRGSGGTGVTAASRKDDRRTSGERGGRGRPGGGRTANWGSFVKQGAAAAACALFLALAYLFLDARTRGHYTWPLRIGVGVAFIATCAIIAYMRAAA